MLGGAVLPLRLPLAKELLQKEADIEFSRRNISSIARQQVPLLQGVAGAGLPAKAIYA